MTLGIVAAMHAEMRTITRQSLSIGTVAHHSDTILLALSGIGPQRARAAGELLLKQGATALLSWGTAAALDSRLTPGSLVLPKTVMAADGMVFTVTPEWHECLHRQLSGSFEIYSGTLVERPTVLSSANVKRALFEHSSGIATDMESAALAAVAREAGALFLIIRVIADSADMAVPQHLITIMQNARPQRQLRLLAAVILHPREWLAIVRLAWGFRAARKTLMRIMKLTVNLDQSSQKTR